MEMEREVHLLLESLDGEVSGVGKGAEEDKEPIESLPVEDKLPEEKKMTTEEKENEGAPQSQPQSQSQKRSKGGSQATTAPAPATPVNDKLRVEEKKNEGAPQSQSQSQKRPKAKAKRGFQPPTVPAPVPPVDVSDKLPEDGTTGEKENEEIPKSQPQSQSQKGSSQHTSVMVPAPAPPVVDKLPEEGTTKENEGIPKSPHQSQSQQRSKAGSQASTVSAPPLLADDKLHEEGTTEDKENEGVLQSQPQSLSQQRAKGGSQATTVPAPATPVDDKLREEGTAEEKENEIVSQSQPQSQSQSQKRPKAKGGFQAPSVSKVLKLINRPSKLTKQDVTCPICWSVLYEPTTLPCNHSLCVSCFLKHVDETSLYCPCCRRRLSVWSRKAKKKNELIDQELWLVIKTEFPEIVEARASGMDSPADSPTSSAQFESLSQIGAAGDTCSQTSQMSQRMVRDGVFAKEPGEMFKELQEILVPHEMDIQTQREQEDAASVDLIQKLQSEVPAIVQPNNEDEDLLLAHKLQEELDNEYVPLKATRLTSGIVKKRCVRNLLDDFDDFPQTPSEDEAPSSPEVKLKKKPKPRPKKSHKKKVTGEDNQNPKPAKKAKPEATVTSGALEQSEDVGSGTGQNTASPPDQVESEPAERFVFSPFSVKLRLHTDDYVPDSAEKKFPSLPPINSQNENDEVILGQDEYFYLEKEARMLKAMKSKVEQEESDRALAERLQQSIDKGIENPRGRHSLDEYSLRNWRKEKKQ